MCKTKIPCALFAIQVLYNFDKFDISTNDIYHLFNERFFIVLEVKRSKSMI